MTKAIDALLTAGLFLGVAGGMVYWWEVAPNEAAWMFYVNVLGLLPAAVVGGIIGLLAAVGLGVVLDVLGVIDA